MCTSGCLADLVDLLVCKCTNGQVGQACARLAGLLVGQLLWLLVCLFVCLQAYGKTTYLITSLQLVPRGTEGAVSLEGTLAGLGAAAVYAATALALGQVSSRIRRLAGGVGWSRTLTWHAGKRTGDGRPTSVAA